MSVQVSVLFVRTSLLLLLQGDQMYLMLEMQLIWLDFNLLVF